MAARPPRHRAAGPSGGIVEPVPPALARLLRRAVLDHARTEHRRSYPPVLHVGVPGRAVRTFVAGAEEPLDHAVRADVVQAMVRTAERTGEPLVWLTRGEVGPAAGVHEADVAWTAAVIAAGAELGRALPLVVVTRRSWRDPRTGTSRTWKRVRQR